MKHTDNCGRTGTSGGTCRINCKCWCHQEKTQNATIEFIDVTYSLKRSDLRLIENALEIINPDSTRQRHRVEYLRNMFATLAERPKP